MTKRPRQYGCGFDWVLAIPLVVYLLLITALVVGIFTGISLDAIKIALSDSDLLDAVKLSIITSFSSTALSLLVAVPAGYVLSRRCFRGASFMDAVLDLPIVLPPLVMGLAVLIFFNTSAGRFIDRGIWSKGIFVYQPLGVILVQFVVGCAFVVRVVKSGFDALDSRYEEVALTLGANRRQAFIRVVLPNIVPSLVAAAVIGWARIFGLFGPVLLVAGTMRGRTEIMPTTIFLETSIGRIEVALVVGAFMILISMLTLAIFKRLGGRGYLW